MNSIYRWLLLKGIAWGLKEVEKQNVMKDYVLPQLIKMGLSDAKSSLIGLFQDWIDELRSA